jgi:hypothetical protein
MAPQLEDHTDINDAYIGPLGKIPSLGFAPRRKRATGNLAWRDTVIQHVPESWPAARLALQARIAALDIED